MNDIPLEFFRDASCARCDLHSGAKSVCIPTRGYGLADVPQHDTALLVVGEKPGSEEDQRGLAFCGVIGDYLDRIYLRHTAIAGQADIYLTNAVRCRVPGNGTPTQSQLNRCEEYLTKDLEALRGKYRRVVILACGAPAARITTGLSSDDLFRKQGMVGKHGVPVFGTVNPAVLLPGRDPSQVMAADEHLRMLGEFLRHNTVPMHHAMPEPQRALSSPDFGSGPVALDIETYGAVEGLPRQSVFHPMKALHIDKCDPKEFIRTVALAWRNPSGNICSSVYVWSKPKERLAFYSAMAYAHREQRPLLGMNLVFDLMFLRTDPWCRKTLRRNSGWQLRELSIANYLNYELRPERSLKSISPLLRVYDYSEELSLKEGKRYPCDDDPALLHYNAADAVATLLCFETLRDRSLHFYPNTNKHNDFSERWFSDLIWCVLEMSEAGVSFDATKLDKLHQKLKRRSARYQEIVKARWGGVLQGKGSQKYIRNLIEEAVHRAGLAGDPRLQVTAKKGNVSTKADNMHLLLGVLPVGDDLRLQIRFLEAYRGVDKLRNTYTEKLLGIDDSVASKSRLIEGVAYPTWYPVPSQTDDRVGGGTKQGRLAAKGPAIQTCPKVIEKCMSVRWPGSLIAFDYSQVELRVAAFLSGDQGMLAEYEKEDADLHIRTTKLLFGEDYAKLPNAKALRKIGKTLNFLTLYGGGAKKFQETMRRMHGMEMALPECEALLWKFRKQYPQLTAWQRGLIREACTKGHLELPFTGQSRLFLGHPKAVEKSYSAEIMNFPVQTVAANLMLSAQRTLGDRLREADSRALIVRNVHDAIYVEVPHTDTELVTGLAAEILPCPPFKTLLESHLNRPLNLRYEMEVLTTRPA